MKYSRILKGMLGLMLFGLIAGCQDDDSWGGKEKIDVQDRIVLSLSNGGRQLTRAVGENDYWVPTDAESSVTHFDVFVMDAIGAVVWYERVSASETGSTGTVMLEKQKSFFTPDAEYTVYVIANCLEKDKAYFGTIKTLSDLMAVEVQTSYVHATGQDDESPNVPKTFMMDGHSDATVLNDGDRASNLEVEVSLRRAAAKMTIILHCGEHARFLPLSESDAQVTRKVVNFADQTTVLQPTNEDAYRVEELYTSSTRSPRGIEQQDNEDGTAGSTVAITVYSYSHNWATGESADRESYLIARIPISYCEKLDVAEGEEQVWESHTENYYKIPVRGVQGDEDTDYRLKRNYSYFTTVEIDGLGASQEEKPVTLETTFFKVQEWVQEDIYIGGDDDSRPKYLALSVDELQINNASEATVSFASSSVASVEVTKVSYINKFGIETDITDTDHGVTASVEGGLNGTLRINSELPENSLSVRYIELTVTNTDGETETLLVEQYPSEYVTSAQGYYSYRDDFNGTNHDGTPTTYVTRGTSPYYIAARWTNNSWAYYFGRGSNTHFFSSKVVTAYTSSGENAGKSSICYYSWYTYTGSPSATSTSSNDYTVSSTVNVGHDLSSTNARIYHVQIMTLANAVNYVLGLPKMDDDGYTATDDDAPGNSKIVSPSFMIASQLGTSRETDSEEAAKQHCAQYVEVANRGNKTDNKDLVTYRDWRLPTQAELLLIHDYQGTSDVIDEVLTSDYYWAANGVINTATGELVSGNTQEANIRCIRNAYKDGESN